MSGLDYEDIEEIKGIVDTSLNEFWEAIPPEIMNYQVKIPSGSGRHYRLDDVDRLIIGIVYKLEGNFGVPLSEINSRVTIMKNTSSLRIRMEHMTERRILAVNEEHHYFIGPEIREIIK